MSKPVLGYWKIRGLAQPARLMLHYVGEDYEEKYYEALDPNDGPDYSQDSWFREKNMLGLDFPNLPYYIDGDIKITQGNALYRYIARKYDLRGRTEQERVLVDILADQVMDMRNKMIRVSYNPAYKQIRKKYEEQVSERLKAFERFLGSKIWLVGEQITFPDFHFYELLDQHEAMFPSLLQRFPNLAKYCERFEAIPQIKAYMDSTEFIRSPINNKTAYFGALTRADPREGLQEAQL